MSICDRLRIPFAKLAAVVPGRLPSVPCYWAWPGLASHCPKELPGVCHSSEAMKSTRVMLHQKVPLCSVKPNPSLSCSCHPVLQLLSSSTAAAAAPCHLFAPTRHVHLGPSLGPSWRNCHMQSWKESFMRPAAALRKVRLSMFGHSGSKRAKVS